MCYDIALWTPKYLKWFTGKYNQDSIIEKKEWVRLHKANNGCSVCNKKEEELRQPLHFHHINPKTKTGEIGKMIQSARFTLRSLQAEAYKCLLACHNCHVGIHRVGRSEDNPKDGSEYEPEKKDAPEPSKEAVSKPEGINIEDA